MRRSPRREQLRASSRAAHATSCRLKLLADAQMAARSSGAAWASALKARAELGWTELRGLSARQLGAPDGREDDVCSPS